MIGQEERKMRIHSTIRSISLRLFSLALVMLAMSAASSAQFRVAITVGPPALPVYEQPICPGDGYLWTPGYWAWDDDIGDYYWVPGTWVEAPEVGFLWTPAWWGWGGSAFLFHEGFWGPTVGFYGGINYGFGYFGVGFAGGRWDNGHFLYNRAVLNVDVTNIHNVYNTTVNNVTVNRVSYNGGNGGIEARPTAQEEAAEHERHIPPVAAQTQHLQAARGNSALRASANHGKPPIAATAKPGEFSGRGVAPAREAGAPNRAEENRGGSEPRGETPAARSESGSAKPVVHPNDMPPAERPAAPNTGNAKLDQKYQKQQQKLSAQQDKERQKLQQKQDQEHQQLTQQKANEAKTQQVEQKHQQQTQQLQQRHASQQQQMQTRQAPRAAPAPAPGRPR
jgi:WXXGXW repeat (2 copies)